MPLSFSIISIANISDADSALKPLVSLTEVNGGDATETSTLSFATVGDVPTEIDLDLLGDDNGTTLSAPITINGTTYAVGSEIETDYSFVAYDLAEDLYFLASHISIDSEYVGAVLSRGFNTGTDSYGDLYTPGNTLAVIDPDDVASAPGWDGFIQGEQFNTGADQLYDNDIDIFENGGLVPCFLRGTRIMMGDGTYAAIETLRVGDSVKTIENRCREIRWIGSNRISEKKLKAYPNLYPVRIQKDALAQGVPHSDLLVSRQHRMMLVSPIAQRMFGASEVLVSAHRLIGLPGIELDYSQSQIEYFHMLFDNHEIVFADGSPSESLHTGREALKAISSAARQEIFTLFPELRNGVRRGAFGRPVPIGRQQKQLIARHRKNRGPLLSEVAVQTLKRVSACQTSHTWSEIANIMPKTAHQRGF